MNQCQVYCLAFLVSALVVTSILFGLDYEESTCVVQNVTRVDSNIIEVIYWNGPDMRGELIWCDCYDCSDVALNTTILCYITVTGAQLYWVNANLVRFSGLMALISVLLCIYVVYENTYFTPMPHYEFRMSEAERPYREIGDIRV